MKAEKWGDIILQGTKSWARIKEGEKKCSFRPKIISLDFGNLELRHQVLGCSSWFKDLTSTAHSPFTITGDLVSIFNRDKNYHFTVSNHPCWSAQKLSLVHHVLSGPPRTSIDYKMSPETALDTLVSSWMSQFGSESHPSSVLGFQGFILNPRRKINTSQGRFIPSKSYIE